MKLNALSKKIVYFLLAYLLPLQIIFSQNHKSSFVLKDEYLIENTKSFDKTLIGGLSGIEYYSGNVFYLISDDKGEHGAPRFYKVSIDYTKKGINKVDFIAVKYLTPSPGKIFVTNSDQVDSSKFIFSDAEAIRYDKSSGKLFWSSEGYDTKSMLSQPFIFAMDTNGLFFNKINTDPVYLFDPSHRRGPQHNAAFEAFAFIPDSDNIVYSSEKSLYQDIRSLKDSLKPIRITISDKKTGNTVSQFAYMLEDLLENNSNGVVDILALSNNTFFILERAFGFGGYIRLYKSTTDDTTSDVKSFPVLRDKKYVALKKELILDFSKTGLKHVDNIEGMTWGYPLIGNKKSILFVSDNNFNNLLSTELILFEYED
ncbi:MAG: esterase-like activity of phytase family protein [Bacteroidetes bacterium]|nr:esterase-like activity of phytase family protein [Bacteroidota bacterium]